MGLIEDRAMSARPSDSRAIFERWIKRTWHKGFYTRRAEGGGYLQVDVSMAWTTWQAAWRARGRRR